MQYVVLVLSLRCVCAARILGLFPTPISSHYAFHERLILELVRKGYEVDVLTNFPRSGNHSERLRQFSIKGSLRVVENSISVEYAQQSVVTIATDLFKFGNEVCEALIKHPIGKELITSDLKYDLVIAEIFASDCVLAFAHIYKAPIMGISSTSMMPWAEDRMGNPDNPAYVSNYFLPSSGRMGFLEKIQLTIVNILSKFWYYLFSTIPAEIMVRELFGTVLNLDKLAKNMSILLVNSHYSVDDPRPLVPSVVEIGGMHISESANMSDKLGKFVDLAEDGVIYFSMGSLINMSTFEKLGAFVDLFARLPQKVVMKGDWKGAMPRNVHVEAWLPQLEILCHPKTKLFITHGGTLSVQEAAYCGVPILGIPFHPNQELNIRNFYSKRAGLLLDYTDITYDTLRDAIGELLGDRIYELNAKRISDVFKDRPQSPLDAAVFWTEYVLRNGGQHMRTKGADLNFFEFFLIDVAVLWIFVMVLIAMAMVALLNFMQDLFDRPPPPANDKKSN